MKKFFSLKPQKESTKENKATLYDNVSETYFDQYMTLSDNQKRNLDNKYDPVNLFPETYDYDVWFENEE